MVRTGWVVVSCCDLETLQPLKEISIPVPRSDCQSEQIPLLETQAIFRDGKLESSGSGYRESVKPSRFTRLLVARYWDWEAALSVVCAASSEVVLSCGLASRQALGESLVKPQAEQNADTGDLSLSDGQRIEPITVSDINSRLRLICGMQVVTAESFERAATKYKNQIQKAADSTFQAAEASCTSSTQMAANDQQSHAQRALHWVSELRAAYENSSVMRLVRRLKKNPQPLATFRVVHCGAQAGPHNSSKPPRSALAVRYVSREHGRCQNAGDTCNEQEQTDSLGVEGSGSDHTVGESASDTDVPAVHLLRLTSCRDSTGQKMHQFLAYTKLSAEWPSAARNTPFVERFGHGPPTAFCCDELQSPLQPTAAQELFRWRLREGPRSALQSCLGVHTDAACVSQETSSWLMPPLPHFNLQLEAKPALLEAWVNHIHSNY